MKKSLNEVRRTSKNTESQTKFCWCQNSALEVMQMHHLVSPRGCVHISKRACHLIYEMGPKTGTACGAAAGIKGGNVQSAHKC